MGNSFKSFWGCIKQYALGKVHIEDITFSSNVVGGVSTPKITIRLDKPCEITQKNITYGVMSLIKISEPTRRRGIVVWLLI